MLFAGLGGCDELGAVAGFVSLAAGLGVDVGVGEDVACPGALADGAAAAAFGARCVVGAGLGFVIGAFFAGAAAFVSSIVAVLAGLEARAFGIGLTALATLSTVTSSFEEVAATVLVDTFLGFVAETTVAFGFLTTVSLTASLTALTCSLVAWAFFGRVVDTCRMFWYRLRAVLGVVTPILNHPLPHLDKSCALGPNLNILSILCEEL